jgi:hypothetical protein
MGCLCDYTKLHDPSAAARSLDLKKPLLLLGVQIILLALATDFPAIWDDPRTLQRERKRMIGLLIEDVTLIKQREITAAVRFRGGATTTLTLPRPLTA